MTCVSCNREIPPERLRAMPLTELCVKCQARQDVPPITPDRILEAMATVEIDPSEMWGR